MLALKTIDCKLYIILHKLMAVMVLTIASPSLEIIECKFHM